MSISATIYSNSNSSSKSVTVSFEGDILAASNTSSIPLNTTTDYFFKFNCGAKTTSGGSLGVRLNMGLSDLVLNGQKQSQTNTANAYSSISTMVVDYLYDYIYGHIADQYSSGVSQQYPMQF